MANKFTKSVLERQAKEAKDARLHSKTDPAPSLSAAPDSKPKAAAETDINTPPVISTPAAVPVQTPPPAPVAPKRQSRAAVSGQVDLSAFIIRNHERTAKNKTFYLDAAVIDAIKKAAAAQKVTDSKLVNDILKKILGVP